MVRIFNGAATSMVEALSQIIWVELLGEVGLPHQEEFVLYSNDKQDCEERV